MRGGVGGLAVAIILLIGAFPANAQNETQTKREQNLDEQVQQLKEETLHIDQELRRLEERLVFPSSSQVAVFLSVEPSSEFSLDSIEVKLDGEPFTSHIYGYHELQALLDGGVQRLRVANVTDGTHRLDVTIKGVATDNIDYDVSNGFNFDKNKGPKLIELHVTGTGSRQPGMELRTRQ